MPIFNKKSNFKAPRPRTGRVTEAVCPRTMNLSENSKDLHLDLFNEKRLRFVDGIWIQHSSSMTAAVRTTELNVDDLVKLKGKMDQLEEENNLLQVKVDILTDLLTENLCKAGEGQG